MNVKMWSTSFVIRELQLKTISYPLAPTRMVESETPKMPKDGKDVETQELFIAH